MDEVRPVEVAFPIQQNLLFTYLAPPEAAVGVRVEARLKNRRARGVVVRTDVIPPENIALRPIEKVLDSEPLFGPHTLRLAAWIAEHTLCPLGQAVNAMLPGARQERDPPLVAGDVELHPVERLSDEQRRAVEAITASRAGWFYLYGQTGSGKTEVYLQAAQRTVAEGRSVLYLVPEISLTYQLVEQIRRRFQRVAVLHSGLTPSQRLREWQRIRRGEVDVVVGARSAVFAPLANVGLIVVDEEQEPSYKSQSVPRYHARSIALVLSRWHEARLVLGSATPSLESLHAIEQGQIQRLELSRRLAGGEPPTIRLLDTRRQPDLIAPELAEALLKTHAEGLQSVLLLNRRGYTNLYHCLKCHFELHCPRCSVPVTYHKRQALVVCHHCGWTGRPPEACPECGSTEVGWSGYGTELVEQEVRRLFPQVRLARLDSDTVSSRGEAEAVIHRFARGELDLLLGTQMIAKGLNFPRLKTVGILNADLGLSLPDFRAAERVYSLIRQTAGRAGRYRPDGEVYLQTYRPEYWVIRLAAEGRDQDFVRRELEIRRQLGFPPFSRLLRIVIRHRKEDRAHADAQALALWLDEHPAPGVSRIGPAPCPIEKLNGWYRRHLFLRSSRTGELRELGKRLMDYRCPNRSDLELDMDPYHLR